MPIWSIIYHWVKVAALCIMVVNLHVAAVAGNGNKSLSCPTVAETTHGSGSVSHHNACCAGTQCCPVIPVLPRADPPAALVQLPTSYLDQSRPFLIVRGLDPPPKSSAS